MWMRRGFWFDGWIMIVFVFLFDIRWSQSTFKSKCFRPIAKVLPSILRKDLQREENALQTV